MNEEYIILDGNVVVSDGKGIKGTVPYTDNILDILKLENIYKFLMARIDEDEKRLAKDMDDRVSRLKDYRSMSLMAAGAAVGATVIAFPLFGLGTEPVSSIFGELPKWASYFSIMTPSMVLVSQFFALEYLLHRPSKVSIDALRCILEYERTEFEYVCDALVDLKTDTTVTSVPKNMATPKKLDYKDEVKRIKDGINLRYYSIVLRKYYEKLYRQGTLEETLLKDGAHPVAVADFMEYLDNNLIFEASGNKLAKTM